MSPAYLVVNIRLVNFKIEISSEKDVLWKYMEKDMPKPLDGFTLFVQDRVYLGHIMCLRTSVVNIENTD